jgi:hypothetical protein
MSGVPAVKPFRALRYAPTRVDLGAVLGGGSDPRGVAWLLNEERAPDDGVDGPTRRACLRLAEWRRAGILHFDDQPALYALRTRAGDVASRGLFCAIGVEGAPAAADPARATRLEQLGVSVEPVVAAFQDPRVTRAFDTAIERDADASFRIGGDGFELWCVDDESTTARITGLLSQAALTIERGEASWSAHAAWWRKKSSATDDHRLHAGAFALAFLHSSDDPWANVPVGAVMAPLTGTL